MRTVITIECLWDKSKEDLPQYREKVMKLKDHVTLMQVKGQLPRGQVEWKTGRLRVITEPPIGSIPARVVGFQQQPLVSRCREVHMGWRCRGPEGHPPRNHRYWNPKDDTGVEMVPPDGRVERVSLNDPPASMALRVAHFPGERLM